MMLLISLCLGKDFSDFNNREYVIKERWRQLGTPARI